RAQLRADPAVRDDGRGDRDHRRVRRDVRGHVAERAACVAGAVPVAPRGDAVARRGRAAGYRQGRRRAAAARDCALPRLSGRSASVPLLPARRASPPSPELTVRRILLVLGVIVAIVAAIALLNGLVDPEDEFYSGDALSTALAANCLLAYDVVDPRSYPELKRDLFPRRHPTRLAPSS